MSVDTLKKDKILIIEGNASFGEQLANAQTQMIIAMLLGAAFGDWVSYWIGYKLENRVYHMWPLSRNPELIPKGEEFVKKWEAGYKIVLAEKEKTADSW